MGFAVFLGSVLVLVLWILVAIQFGKIAEDKGYDRSKYGLWTGFLGIIGMLMVCALPDRGRQQNQIILQQEKAAEKDTSYNDLPDL